MPLSKKARSQKDLTEKHQTTMAFDGILPSKQIEAEIRRRIVSGIYPIGSYLPPERSLAREFGTTRTTLGVALSALAEDHLVLRVHGRGTQIVSPLRQTGKPLIGVVDSYYVSATSGLRQSALTTLHGVLDTLAALQWPIQLKSSGSPAHEVRLEDLSECGAVILIDVRSTYASLIEQLCKQGIVWVGAKAELEIEGSYTYIDHREPPRQSVRTFVQLGHRRIAFIGRDPQHLLYGKAREGYLNGLAENSLPVDPSLIVTCEKTDALSGYLATKPLLELSQPPTAIIAGRDTIAQGVCRAIEERGLQVGHNISVIGFDDLTWPGGSDFITTFREPCYEMGKVAAQMLIERIVNPSLGPEKRRLETPFILRRSAGPPMPNWKSKLERNAANLNLECTNAS